jgi:hypothetical protein
VVARRADRGLLLPVNALATRVDWRAAEDHGGEKEDTHHCLAAERPLHQGVHDEDDRDDGEENSVDVHTWQIVGRVIGPLLALSFPGFRSYPSIAPP